MLWLEESYDNFLWLQQLAIALNDEYRYRFDKEQDHKSIRVLEQIQPYSYECHGLTQFAQAMPEQYKTPGDAVTAYRRFYIGEKLGFARWTKRRIPRWIAST